MKRIYYGRRHCPTCGTLVTKNALRWGAHVRNCTKAKAAAKEAKAIEARRRRP